MIAEGSIPSFTHFLTHAFETVDIGSHRYNMNAVDNPA